MANKELEALLERVPTWPDDVQEDVLAWLKAIEHDVSTEYVLSDEDKASIDRGLDDARNRRFVSPEEMDALFARFRLPK